MPWYNDHRDRKNVNIIKEAILVAVCIKSSFMIIIEVVLQNNHHNHNHHYFRVHYIIIIINSKHRLFIEAMELNFDIGHFEPFFCILAIYDTTLRKRISENFYFHVNPPSIQV